LEAVVVVVVVVVVETGGGIDYSPGGCGIVVAKVVGGER